MFFSCEADDILLTNLPSCDIYYNKIYRSHKEYQEPDIQGIFYSISTYFDEWI